MKKKKLSSIIAVIALLSLNNNALADDAETIVSVSEEKVTTKVALTDWDSYNTYVYDINITTATSLNTLGSTATGVGNTTGATTINGNSVNIQSTTSALDPSALVISGQNGDSIPGTATGAYPLIPNGTGVLITGAGQGSGSDVYIASQDGRAAISVTNTGVQIISPAGTSGTPINVSSTNTYGVAGANNTGSVTNNFGTGGSGTSGVGGVTQTTTNNIGGGGGSNSQVNNTFGGGSSSSTGLVSNTIGSSVSGGGTVTNSFGGGTGTSINNIGGGSGISTTTIGSTTVGSSVQNQAGNSSSTLSNGVSTTSVQSGGGVGNSILSGGTTTSANSGTVLNGATGTFAVVDQNGKITYITGTATQSVTATTLTNGLGNTNGLIVTETQATLSGGTQSSSMTLNDNGATFSNSSNGQPIQVHGVADGTSNFDAVNVRQLNAVMIGISGVAAMTNIPTLASDKKFNIGAGIGGFDNQSAIAIGGNVRINEQLVTKATVSRGLTSNDSNISTTTWGVGVALSF